MTAQCNRRRPSRAKVVASATAPATRQRRAAADSQVTITHPERVVFPELRLTKRDVVDYYVQVAAWIVPELRDRPLSVLRCPGGTAQACFFQKHLTTGLGRHVRGVRLKDSSGQQTYLCIDDVRGLLELVQMNTLEFHPWGAHAGTTSRADRVVFDLDPHASVDWKDVAAGAALVRAHLASLGLTGLLRTSGGKGLHVVVPLRPGAPWTQVRTFARTVAESLTASHPDRFVAVAGEAKRGGRIFIDWLRNSRGATSIASYSLRARADAGVAMPLAWNQLAKLDGGHGFTIVNALAHIHRRRADPWRDIDSIEQVLPRR
jgi:bifunctional non-homologous end joining protein LigD